VNQIATPIQIVLLVPPFTFPYLPMSLPRELGQHFGLGEQGTNAVESLHMSLRKIIKTRGSFPSEEAAVKLLYWRCET